MNNGNDEDNEDKDDEGEDNKDEAARNEYEDPALTLSHCTTSVLQRH